MTHVNMRCLLVGFVYMWRAYAGFEVTV